MRTRNWIAWPVLLALSFGVMAGCTPAATDRMQRQSLEPRYDNRGVDFDGDGDRSWLSGNNNLNNPPVNLTNMTPMGGGYADLTQGTYSGWVTADRISDLVRTVPGVESASSVLKGQTAVVAIRINRNVPKEREGAIMQEVRRLMLIQAPSFRSVHVTADKSMYSRVFNVSQSVRSGRPPTSLDREIDHLIQSIPETPSR